MPQIISCPLNLSLEFSSLINVTIMLWNHNGSATLLAKLNSESLLYSDQEKAWLAIQHEVVNKVSTLLLPEIIKKKIIAFIRPIGREIFNWKECQRKISRNKTFLQFCIARICWTRNGTVDYKRTAERLMNEKRLRITLRYKLACIYCSEREIRVLWNQMNSNQREIFCYKQRGSMLPDLISFWTLTIKGEAHRLHDIFHGLGQSVYEHYFFEAIKKGNKVAVEYIYSMLTDVEKKEYMSNALNLAVYGFDQRIDSGYFLAESYYADIAYFLFSQIEDPEKIIANEGWAVFLLMCFFNWPYQSYFMKIAERVLTALSESEFSLLLSEIVEKCESGFQDCNYSELFKVCWQIMPKSCKKSTEKLALSFIEELFKIRDQENISLILKDVTYDEQEQLIFGPKGLAICVDLALNNEWDLLTFFISKCLSTKEKLEKFRNVFFEKSFHYFTFNGLNTREGVENKISLLIADIIQTHF